MAETLLLFPAIVGLVYWLPGRLFLECLPGDRRDDTPFALSVGLGLVLVNVPVILAVGLAGLVGPALLERWMVLAASALATLGLGVAAWVRRGRGGSFVRFAPLTRERVLLGALTAAATLFFLVRYDGDRLAEEACMVRASMAVNVDYLRPDRVTMEYDRQGEMSPYRASPNQARELGRNQFLLSNQMQRLGPVILISPFFALFGAFGFRLLYALQGLLLPGLGFMLGLAVFRRGDGGGKGPSWAPWAVAGLLALNPYTLASPSFDENFLALGFGTLSLALLLRAAVPPFAAGMAFALFLAVRHVGLLLLPAVAWYLARVSEKPWRSNLRFLGGLALFGLPCLVMHGALLVYQGQLFEGAIDRPPSPHSLFGIPFTLPVLLNFPFVEQPLRSPYMAWPTLAAVPLDLLRRFGLLAAALAPAGVLALMQANRRRAWLLVAWIAPILLLLMVQSNWTEPNKMGVPGSFLPPVVLALVAGAACMLESTRSLARRLGLLGVGLLVPVAAWASASAWHAPLDPRVTTAVPTYLRHVLQNEGVLSLPEHPAFLEADRRRHALSPWPDLRLSYLHPAVVRLRVAQLFDDLRRPSAADYERSLLDVLPRLVMGFDKSVNPLSIAKVLAGQDERATLHPLRVNGADVGGGLPLGTRRMALDLREPVVLATRPLLDANPPDVPVLQADRVSLVKDLHLPWAGATESLLVGRDRFGTTWVVVMPGPVSPSPWPEWVPEARVDGGAYSGLLVPAEWPIGQPIHLIDVRSIAPFRAYERTLVVQPDGLWSSPVEATSLR